ncbi:unnamed protein product [Prorocentrum cordatum]|uniref:Secreted protein n=1 Tax=Prorocentrum cordatum TaxID=2364126 RepID=A0ABN9YB35_9DINO|nr:unnamed protein product [Polarella glacialis]
MLVTSCTFGRSASALYCQYQSVLNVRSFYSGPWHSSSSLCIAASLPSEQAWLGIVDGLSVQFIWLVASRDHFLPHKRSSSLEPAAFVAVRARTGPLLLLLLLLLHR